MRLKNNDCSSELTQIECLNDILSRWHAHCKGYGIVFIAGSDPMFRNAQSRPDWDSASDIMDARLMAQTLEALDFHVSEIKEPYKSAIHELARNLHTGYSVWRSPRLPVDPLDRGVIVVEARKQLTERLSKIGVL